MFKPLLKIAVAPALLCCAFSPVMASAEAPAPVTLLANPAMGFGDGAQGEAALMDIFAKLFDIGDKTPIDPAQLALGQAAAAKLLPEGAYGKMMNQLLKNFLKPMLALEPGMSGTKIVSKTGIDHDFADALTEDQRNAVADIFDPDRQARSEGLLALLGPIMLEASKALEPPMREGIARAYARKFSAAQLGEINSFFATPSGAAFAAESFAIQADPEVLSATMQAMPIMLTKIMDSASGLEAKMKTLPQERELSELSAADLDKLAKLLSTTPKALRDYGANAEAGQTIRAADAAGEIGCMADAAMAAADAAASEGYEPWCIRDNWAPEDLAKVEKAEDQAGAAFDAVEMAEEAAIANARARLSKKK